MDRKEFLIMELTHRLELIENQSAAVVCELPKTVTDAATVSKDAVRLRLERISKILNGISGSFVIDESERLKYGNKYRRFLKRIIHKLVKWYVKPITAKVNIINSAYLELFKEFQELCEIIGSKKEQP